MNQAYARSADGVSGLRSIQSAINIGLQVVRCVHNGKRFTLHTDAIAVKSSKTSRAECSDGENNLCSGDGFSFDVTVSSSALNSDGLFRWSLSVRSTRRVRNATPPPAVLIIVRDWIHNG